ncbi:MAG: hypothetical protein ACLUHE_03620 [Christensenellales bacterium]
MTPRSPRDGGGRESLRVVLIADLHLGYSVGAKRIEDMVGKGQRAERGYRSHRGRYL